MALDRDDLDNSASELEDEQNSEDENIESDADSDTQDISDNVNNSNKRELELDNDVDNLQSKKKIKKELLKPPTAEEMINLQETEYLFKSHLSKLQIEEFLKEINIKPKYVKKFEVWFGKLKETLAMMPTCKELSLSGKDVKDNLRTDVIKFIRPNDCSAFNMHKIFGLKESELVVDVNVGMPKNCFLEKDYLNNRYIVKCKRYLKFIFKKLQKVGLICTAEIPVSQNAILQLTPNISNKIKVNLHVTPSEDTFKLSRFEPDKNNLRQNVLFDHLKDVDPDKLKEYGTPYFNSVLLLELTQASNYKHIEDSIKDLGNVQDAIKLLQLWQQQRGLHLNGFSNNILKHTISYLMLKKNINRLMSSYQVIRNFWLFLCRTNWHENPISLCENVEKQKLDMFHEHFDVVFLDRSGSCNLAAFLNLEVYMKVRSEAEMAVKFLDDGQVDTFLGLFKVRLDPLAQYDALLRFPNILYDNVYKKIEDAVKYKHVGCLQTLIIGYIIKMLKKGLSNRISNIVPLKYDECESITFPKSITFGITLNAEHAFSTLVKGPPADSQEALKFKTFWETLSECRRFVDGSICEAVHFPKDTFHERRKIFKEIIDFIVKKKLNLDNHEVICNEMENMLIIKDRTTPFPVGTCEEASLKVISYFDVFTKILRGLKLPLEIAGIQGTSEIFSYTAVHPPIPTNYKWGGKMTSCEGENIVLKEKHGAVPRYVEPIEIVMHLAKSSKWPNDIEAIFQLKMAYYLQISKILKEEHNVISNVKENGLDVFYKGLVFRLRLYQPKEVSLMKKSKTLNGLTVYDDTVKTIEIEKSVKLLPRIIGTLNGIQSQTNSFGASTTLIKRWIRAHLIDDFHFPDVAISLINAYLYQKPGPYNRSNLPQVAFLRFLQFMADFDGNLQFITVNFNNEISREVLNEIDEDFQKDRQKYPPLFIMTPFDFPKSLFSNKCTKEILRRISLLASATYQCVNSSETFRNSFIEKLFTPNLEGYDLLIYIKPLINPRRHEQFDFLKNNDNKIVLEEYNGSESTKMPIVGYNPVYSYLQELRKNYNGIALFFHDPYGGNVIGVLWQPQELQEKEFKVTQVNGHKCKNNKLIHLNIEAIINDFYIIGNGLVKTIVKKGEVL